MAACLFALGTLVWSGSLTSAQDGARLTSLTAQAGPNVSNVVGTYCAGCHNGRTRSPSGILLDQFDAALIAASPEVWSRAYRQLQAGAMPPVGAPRPGRATVDAVLTSIEQALSANAKPAAPASSQEIATRLATLLWNSQPDATLLQEAQLDRLSGPAALERQIHRMLADDRAQAFVSRFFFPWMDLDKLGNSDPDTRYFPEYDVSLRDSLAKETELFLLSQLRDDRDPLELWSADYTFLNGQLASHYGVPDVTGPQFRRVQVSIPERAGLLGHGSILMLTSKHQDPLNAAYTSPATRGKWLRLHFLGVPPPNPFPGAQPLKPDLPIAGQTRTLPAAPCVTCHRNFFPLGYALENFDPLGGWRTHDQIGPVDPSGAFVDGTSTNGVVELRQVLLQYPEAFRTTITEQLLIYASTGSVAPSSGTAETLIRARHILHSTPKPRWSALIAAIVQAKSVAGG
jgi:mono/diheme cytochrome c family protein